MANDYYTKPEWQPIIAALKQFATADLKQSDDLSDDDIADLPYSLFDHIQEWPAWYDVEDYSYLKEGFDADLSPTLQAVWQGIPSFIAARNLKELDLDDYSDEVAKRVFKSIVEWRDWFMPHVYEEDSIAAWFDDEIYGSSYGAQSS